MDSIENQNVARKFQSYPEDMRRKLMHLRQLILDVALATPDIGDLEETLKWDEPSYWQREAAR